MKYRLLKDKSVSLNDGTPCDRIGDVFDDANISQHDLEVLNLSGAIEPVVEPADEPDKTTKETTKEIRHAQHRKGRP